jgi:hypothetical protein
MREIEQLPKDFSSYLTDIRCWGDNWRVSEYLHELKKLPMQREIKAIFISNDEDVAPKSLWFFLDGYFLEVRNFLEKGLADIQMTSLKGEAESVNIKIQNFNIDTESGDPNDPVKSKLQISVKVRNDRILALSAVDVPNCGHLLKIYREYFRPLFPI